jgi:hypothetical protein
MIQSSTGQGLAFSEKIRIMPARVNVAEPGGVEEKERAQAERWVADTLAATCLF